MTKQNETINDPGTLQGGRDVSKRAFGKRLKKLMVEKGWNQSEMARRATKHLPPGSREIGRDSISKYCLGHVLPGDVAMQALANALEVRVEDLTLGTAKSEPTTTMEIRQIPGEPQMIWLRINQPVPFDKAIEIMRIMQTPEKKPRH